jgi:sec-independent protein translocase protein TatB
VALVVIGPKDLPRVMRTVGHWVGRARDMARHFRAGVDTMMREAELEEMEKKWREENERIMKLYPPDANYPEPGKPDEMPPIANPESPEEELPPEKRPLP